MHGAIQGITYPSVFVLKIVKLLLCGVLPSKCSNAWWTALGGLWRGESTRDFELKREIHIMNSQISSQKVHSIVFSSEWVTPLFSNMASEAVKHILHPNLGLFLLIPEIQSASESPGTRLRLNFLEKQAKHYTCGVGHLLTPHNKQTPRNKNNEALACIMQPICEVSTPTASNLLTSLPVLR